MGASIDGVSNGLNATLDEVMVFDPALTTRSSMPHAGRSERNGPPSERRNHDANYEDDMQAQLAQYSFAPILLHLACAFSDQKYQWHWRGVCRELFE